MTDKADDAVSLMAQGETFELAEWLANMRRVIDKREILDPTDADILKMRERIRDSRPFERLADKDEFLRVLFTIGQKLQVYDELPKFEEEGLNPLLRALADLVAAIPNCQFGILSAAADEIGKIRKTTLANAWAVIVDFAEVGELLHEVFQRIFTKPKVYDLRTVRGRRKKDETLMIRDCFKAFGINIAKTGSGDYPKKGNDNLELFARCIHYTSGVKPPSPAALRMRLTRADPSSRTKHKRRP
jgi:hypothetical protein